MNFFQTLLLIGTTWISAIEDLRCQKIPNIVTYPSMALAIGYHILSAGLSGLIFSAGGLALGIAFFIVPYLLGGMGAGDAKLMGAAGAVLGPKGVIILAFIVIFLGGIYALILLIIHHDYSRSLLRRLGITLKTFLLTHQLILIPPGKDEKQPVLRYAVPIALGALCYIVMQLTNFDLFLELLGDKSEIFSIAMH